jgi:ribose-phosphate pyrophosphokinase
VIIDDEINTGGSLVEAASALERGGAREIYSCATHGLFYASAIERISQSSITEVIVTDTVPLPPGCDDSRVTVLSVAPLFGEAIKRIHRGESVGALFSSEVKLVEEMRLWEEPAEQDEQREPTRVSAV